MNALTTLENVLPWLPAYYIFNGFLMEKVAAFIDGYAVFAFNCFQVVFELKENHK